LKLADDQVGRQLLANSPVSNDGCGLKQDLRKVASGMAIIHPSAMTGVD